MKKLIFLTGTRADFGKMKSLIDISIANDFDVHVFVTGMHLHSSFGGTIDEVKKNGYKNIFPFINQSSEESMDLTLSNTIEGLSRFVKEVGPDLLVIHGDRVEALAGAIVGALNNILVAHIEGGEVSGTIDELIRHSVSKLSHTHFVANTRAKNRLLQMGEISECVYTIGSPDIDIMLSNDLMPLVEVKKHYNINYEQYAILLFHPVTTDADRFEQYSLDLVDALNKSEQNYIVIYPNNDLGYTQIIKGYSKLKNESKFKIFPSIRFEYFLVLLENAQFIIGNSSAGIREAPYYGVPTINIGNRQDKRSDNDSIINIGYDKNEILKAIEKIPNVDIEKEELFGDGSSDSKFLEIISSEGFWQTKKQKQFKDLKL